MPSQIRRIVTAVDHNGTSVVHDREPVPALEIGLMPGAQFFQVWGTEGQLLSPATDPEPNNHTFFPGPGGTRFGLFRLPPDTAPDPDAAAPDSAALEAGVTEAEQKVPGLLGVFEPDAPGMHQTRTVDYVIVIEGDLAVELDDGVEVGLPVGSCVVQNGARHGWRNKGTTPATLAYVILSAD